MLFPSRRQFYFPGALARENGKRNARTIQEPVLLTKPELECRARVHLSSVLSVGGFCFSIRSLVHGGCHSSPLSVASIAELVDTARNAHEPLLIFLISPEGLDPV